MRQKHVVDQPPITPTRLAGCPGCLIMKLTEHNDKETKARLTGGAEIQMNIIIQALPPREDILQTSYHVGRI